MSPDGREVNPIPVRCPYGQPGDRLWVREAWVFEGASQGRVCVRYRAGGTYREIANWQDDLAVVRRLGNKSPIHMPRWASRLTLEVVDRWPERLQDISEADAKAEGVEPIRQAMVDLAAVVYGGPRYVHRDSYRAGFRAVWDHINAPRGYPWASNPWVWVVEFRRVDAP